MIGKTISHYKILERLGQGGMGDVYKAEDINLQRIVALKFLPPALTRDEEAKKRFIQEARAASALDHPNICTIHEINETEAGGSFIVMACYLGETVKEKIEKGPLTVKEAVEIMIHAARGLAKAHEKGIVHRDIKPANIFVTEDGQVKILDFGIAKLGGQTRMTKAETTLGTVAYMSPEQARGDEVDHRADIWSLGVVLYEMLSGRPPFRGEYEQAVIYGIMNEAPEPITGLRPDIPVQIEQTLDKAMRKNPDERQKDMEELIQSFIGTGEAPAATRPVESARSGIRSAGPYLIMAFIFALIIVLYYTFKPEEEKTTVPPSFRQVTFTGRTGASAISPDGHYIAFVDGHMPVQSEIKIKDMDSGSEVTVFSAAFCWGARWSPDGSRLLFSAFFDEADSGLYIIPRLGGHPRRISKSPWGPNAWSPDGMQIAYNIFGEKKIKFLELKTEDSREISLDGIGGQILDLDWSPKDDFLLLRVDDPEKQIFWRVKTDGSEKNILFEKANDADNVLESPRWSPKGDALYFLQASLKGQVTYDFMKVRVDPRTGNIKGDPHVILSGLQLGLPSFSMTDSAKSFLYTRKIEHSNIWMARADAKGDRSSRSVTPLTTGTTWKSRPDISPDGRHIAFAMSDGSATNIYVMPLPKGQAIPQQDASPRQLTFSDVPKDNPVWSPDGREIAFYSSRGGAHGIWHMRVDGGTPQPFDDSEIAPLAGESLSWAPGKDIIYPETGMTNFKLLNPLSGQQSSLIEVESDGYLFDARWAPDGKKVAVFWNREHVTPPSMGLWVISIADGTQKMLAEGIYNPIRWSSDGAWIYAGQLDLSQPESPTKLYRVPASGGEPELLPFQPFEQFDAGQCAMTPDGRILVYTKIEAQSDAWIVESFDPEIE